MASRKMAPLIKMDWPGGRYLQGPRFNTNASEDVWGNIVHSEPRDTHIHLARVEKSRCSAPPLAGSQEGLALEKTARAYRPSGCSTVKFELKEMGRM